MCRLARHSGNVAALTPSITGTAGGTSTAKDTATQRVGRQ